MANPWDNDEIVQPARQAAPPSAGGNFWDADEIVDDGPGLEIEIVGGIPESKAGQRTGLTPDQVSAANGGRHNRANDSDFARLISGDRREPQVQEGNAVGRFLGDIGGREVLQGAYGLYGALGGDAVNQYILSPIDRALGWGNQLGIGDRTYRDAAAEQADEWGMRRPQTPTQRIMADIGEGLTGTGLTLGLGGVLNMGRQAATSAAPTIQSRLGELLTTQPLLQTISTATGSGAGSAVREAGGGTGAQVAASLVGGLSPGVASYLSGAGTRGALRGATGDRVQRNIEDFAQLGAQPSVGQAGQSRFVQGMENLLAGGPTSAGTMDRFASQQAEDIGSSLSAFAENLYRQASGERAGRAIERGITGEGGFIPRTRAISDALYGRLDEAIPADSRVGVGNARAALADLNAAIPGAPSVSRFFQNARLQGIEQGLADDAEGLGAVLSRPGVREQADDLRARLTDQANTRRAELAQEANAQRQELLSAAGDRRKQLTDAAEAQRAQLTADAEAKRAALYAQARNIEEANNRLRMFGLTDMERVPTKAEIEAQIPTKAQIDAQVPSTADIEAQVMSNEEIARRVTPDSAFNDPSFGQDYIENQVQAFLKTQVDGKLPYEAVSKLRTLVGKELENTSLMSDVPRSKWKAVYGALSKDMEAAATTPQAKQALSRANAYYKARIDRIESIESVIDKNGGPEKVFQAAMSGTRDGATTLRAVMQSLPKEGQQAVTAAFVRRLGLANPGAQNAAGDTFNAATFLTNWNKVSPEARKALFNRHGPSFVKDMDRIARVADNIKSGAEVYRNPAGTANKLGAYAYWIGLITALGAGQKTTATSLAAAGAGGFGVAQAMTNPNVVRWLAQTTRGPVGSVASQLQSLRRIGIENNDSDILAAADYLEQRSNESDDGNDQDEE